MSTPRRHVRALLGLTVLTLAACGGKQPGDTSLLDTLSAGTLTEPSTGDDTESSTTDPSTTDPSGDGDGDSGDGDGDPGDGDGDSGDGDGDSGDGDGDGTDTDAPGCEDGDSGNAPWEGELGLAGPYGEPQPHDGPNFVVDPDVLLSECSPFAQDCPNGEKCVAYASGGGNWDANKCVPVMGDQMAGEACFYDGVVAATDDCDADSACWNVDDMGVGACAPFCTGTPQNPQCDAGATCLVGGNGSLALCVAGCNPIVQDCEDGEACFWTGEDFSCVFTTSDFPPGETCGFINDCAEGNMCVTATSVPNCQGNACCAPFCDLDCGVDSCDQPGTSCQSFFEQGQAPPGNGDIGLCLAN